ncbi:hypothetical protein O181_053538 [Austropuccinia psidii MF-1]|uniref:Uncharacterized protein n=1 Tax=Austropuccinia psidii MF-1 TaxID=1389203 RepID=A0A9Q3E7K5_9BASI|nr:hypothetical protein [Austropuccinia psidii MF-1]
MCFEKASRKIKTSNNDNPFGNKLNEQSAIIQELTDKYSKVNMDDIIETRIKQAINIIKEDNKKVLDDIENSFTEVKTYTIALKKCFGTSQPELSKFKIKLNQVTFDDTRQTELWKELTNKEDMYKIEVINLIKGFQHEFRNSQRCNHKRTLQQCGGDLEHSVKSRTTEHSSADDIIHILKELTPRIRIGSSRVNFKTRFNAPWKDSVDKNPKENSNNIKYKSADVIRKCHICQSTTHLANKCPEKVKVNEIDIEKEPDIEKDDVIEDNSDDKSSIFYESSKDIENINVTFDIMKLYTNLPQLSNGQIYLSRIQDAQLMKTKPNSRNGYTAGNSCITEVVFTTNPLNLYLNQEPSAPLLENLFLRLVYQTSKINCFQLIE